MVRRFIYDSREFPDPDPSLDPDRVRQGMASVMPELATAETRHRKEGEDDIYEFVRRVGTKGSATSAEIVEALWSAPEFRPRIIDLVNELTTPEGKLDYTQAQERQPDINLAVAEAERHMKDTQEAIRRLCELPARSWPG